MVRWSTSRTIVVALFDQGDRSACDRFGGDVADAEAPGGAGEPAVRDQGDLLAEALAGDGGRRGEHLAHPGTAARAS